MKKILLTLLILPVLAHAQVIITVAGDGTAAFGGDHGPATAAQLNTTYDVLPDGSGNIYITDYLNCSIRKVDAAGIITTIAGKDSCGYSGDGGPATDAKLFGPNSLALDTAGNLYFTDYYSNAVRKIDPAGVITTIAGLGPAFTGYPTDGSVATAAELYMPTGVTVDARGNVYISDDIYSVIHKIDAAGIITTIAGTSMTPGYSGDGGPATAALINGPVGITTDRKGNIFFADRLDCRVRKIDTAGIITRVAGGGVDSCGFMGDGGPATNALLFFPYGVSFDAAGNMYIGDAKNNTIRKVDTFGIITTIAGRDSAGYYGDGGAATAALLYFSTSARSDASGNLFIADAYNNCVRKIIAGSMVPTAAVAIEAQDHISVYPNPAHNKLTIQAPPGLPQGEEMLRSITITITNLLGQTVYQTSSIWHPASSINIDVSNLPAGVYFVKVNGTDGYRGEVRKFVKE